MKLQGQTVYVVHLLDENDLPEDYEIFADQGAAAEAMQAYLDEYGEGRSYYDTTTIS